jgi:hypothetical protein
MKQFRKTVYPVLALLLCSLVMTVIIASLLLAQRDASVYPGNIYAGPVPLGNLTRAQAWQKPESENNAGSLSIDCIVGQDIYELKLKDLGIKLDAVATIQKIDNEIGKWSLLSHSLNRGKKQVIPPVWIYDRNRLEQSLDNLAVAKYKEAVDARVVLVGDYLLHQSEQYGVQIVTDKAADLLADALNKGKLTVELPVRNIPPSITRSQINGIKDLLSVQAVPLSSNYPSGDDASWAFPGRIIMPGESIPISLMIDASAEDGQETIGKWQAALSAAAEEAGLVYKISDQELSNPTEQPVALFITQEEELGLIRIFGQQKDSSSRLSISRTYRPLIASVVAGGQSENGPDQRIYRHSFTDGRLQITELLEYSPAAPGTSTSSKDEIPVYHK